MPFQSENCDFFHDAVSRHFHRSMKFHDVFTTFSQRFPPVVFPTAKLSVWAKLWKAVLAEKHYLACMLNEL